VTRITPIGGVGRSNTPGFTGSYNSVQKEGLFGQNSSQNALDYFYDPPTPNRVETRLSTQDRW